EASVTLSSWVLAEQVPKPLSSAVPRRPSRGALHAKRDPAEEGDCHTTSLCSSNSFRLQSNASSGFSAWLHSRRSAYPTSGEIVASKPRSFAILAGSE